MLISLIMSLRSADDLLLGFVAVIAYLIAVCCAFVLHEVAHGLVAYWNGDYTAKAAGRLTLNPIKHFDVTGLMM